MTPKLVLENDWKNKGGRGGRSPSCVTFNSFLWRITQPLLDSFYFGWAGVALRMYVSMRYSRRAHGGKVAAVLQAKILCACSTQLHGASVSLICWFWTVIILLSNVRVCKRYMYINSVVTSLGTKECSRLFYCQRSRQSWRIWTVLSSPLKPLTAKMDKAILIDCNPYISNVMVGGN